MKLSRFLIVIFVGLICIMPLGDILAQCPMCRIAAESNLENGGTAGKGLNLGILYMLMLPYALVGFIGFIWYKNRKLEPES